jgi:hypothetical protein
MVHSHSNHMRVASYVTGLIVQCSAVIVILVTVDQKLTVLV